MNLLVGGVTGQLGRALVEAATQRQIGVVPVARALHGRPAPERMGRLLRRFQDTAERTIEGDVTLPSWGLHQDAIERLAPGIDVVVNLAAETDWSVPARRHYATNFIGAQNGYDLSLALAEASGHCVTYWYASSIHAAGSREGLIPELPLGSDPHRTPYEQSKWLAEQELLSRAQEQSGVQVAIARIGGLVGDSRSGETTRRNSLYLLADSWAQLPARLVAHSGGRVDMLPRDICAEMLLDAIAAGRRVDAPEIVHICAGEDAPTLRSLLAVAEAVDLQGRLPPKRLIAAPTQALLRAVENVDRVTSLSPALRNLLIGLRYVTFDRIFERERLRALVSQPLPSLDTETLARLVFGLPATRSTWSHDPESLARFAG